jgi:anti-sigma regulatory factor (Ser/Thr protein kinase)
MAFAADSSIVGDVRRFVAAEANRLTFSEYVDDLQLAVTEACANAILHSGTNEVRITITLVGSCLEIIVQDDGIYRKNLPFPELDGQGHRGLHLMAAMVDDFSLRRGTEDQHGTTVTLLKCKRAASDGH